MPCYAIEMRQTKSVFHPKFSLLVFVLHFLDGQFWMVTLMLQSFAANGGIYKPAIFRKGK